MSGPVARLRGFLYLYVTNVKSPENQSGRHFQTIFDTLIVPQRPEFPAGFAVYITLSSARRYSMELSIKWHQPIPLLDGDKDNLIYVAEGLDSWRDVPGVYMFARIFNDEICPLYIGKAESIGSRAWQHFKSNTKLMTSIKKSSNGARVFIPGKFMPKPGQSTKKCIALVERALIDHALAEGYELLNVQGAKTPTHRIRLSGFLGVRNITGKSLSFKAQG